MSKYCDQDYYIEEFDEDKILAGLSVEELQQLQNEMDNIAPDKTEPVGKRQNSSSVETPAQGFQLLLPYHLVFSHFLTFFFRQYFRLLYLYSLIFNILYIIITI